MNDQDKIAYQAAEIANLNLVLAERKAKIAELMGEAARAALPVGIVARDLMPKRTAFIAWCGWRGLETVEDQDAWGKRKFKHSHIEALWEGWFNAPDGGRSEALVLLLEILRCKRVIGNGDNADHRQALNDFNAALEAAQAIVDPTTPAAPLPELTGPSEAKIADERTLFEEWAKREAFNIGRGTIAEQYAWGAWQTRAARSAASPSPAPAQQQEPNLTDKQIAAGCFAFIPSYKFEGLAPAVKEFRRAIGESVKPAAPGASIGDKQ